MTRSWVEIWLPLCDTMSGFYAAHFFALPSSRSPRQRPMGIESGEYRFGTAIRESRCGRCVLGKAGDGSWEIELFLRSIAYFRRIDDEVRPDFFGHSGNFNKIDYPLLRRRW